jgi:glc operon protein GlcG
MTRILLGLCLTLMLIPSPAPAQLRDAKVLTLDGAKNILAGAVAEAKKNNWKLAIAVVDASGGLIAFHKMDGTGPSNVDFAIAKARTSARYRRATRLLDSALTAGRTAFLATDALPIEGGVPIVVDSVVIGAVGASGATSAQDAQAATVGINALIK